MYLELCLMILIIIFCGNIDQLLNIVILLLMCTIIYKCIIKHFIEKYLDYKKTKELELANEEYIERKKQKEIKEAEEYQRVKDHAKQVYLDITNGKRPMPKFEEIMGERISSNNPKIVKFCKKNNMTVDDLMIMYINYYR